MLTAQYAATRFPKGLKRLIIANSTSSTELASIYAGTLLDQFPKEYAAMMRKHEQDGTMDSDEYQEGIMKFHKKHTCSVDIWPDELMASFEAIKKNPTVYLAMYYFFFSSNNMGKKKL